jgi:hypothetical protein
MNRFLILSALLLSFMVLSCQSAQKRTPASAALENPFKDNKGSAKNPMLNEEYPVLTTSASPVKEHGFIGKGKPYIDFEGKYGLESEDFARYDYDPLLGEQKDFEEQARRIFVIQLLNLGVEAGEIKRLVEGGANLSDPEDVIAKLNDDRAKTKKPQLNTRDLFRGFHAKAHACLKADFVVYDRPNFESAFNKYKLENPKLNYGGKTNQEIYDSLRAGLFKKPTTYRSLVRYSNGVGINDDDTEIDVRGLAFKLFARADGLPIQDEATGHTNQDFLMTNKPNPFGENSRQFINFAFSKAEGPIDFIDGLVSFTKRRNRVENGKDVDGDLRLSFKDLVSRHLSLMPAAKRKAFGALIGIKPTRPNTSLTTETFWSGAPYRLGTRAMKFQVVPHNKFSGQEGVNKADPNYLRTELKERLKNNVKYTFMVQFQTDVSKTPIEDTLVPWRVEDSPPIPLGELVIFNGQNFDPSLQEIGEGTPDRLGYCRSTVFNPWNHFTGHKPMSNLNRGRKAVYEASARNRHGASELTLEDVEKIYGAFPVQAQ